MFKMKTTKSIFGTILLIAITLVIANCKKAIVEPSTFNYSIFSDTRDGNNYKTIKIGNQEWMAENLDFKTATGSWSYGSSEDSDPSITKYGRLYTWEAAQQAVPSGWHLPTDTEWKQLEMFLGMSQTEADGIAERGTDEGGKLKATSGWTNNRNGTDVLGFTALPGGFRSNFGSFVNIEFYGYWWTASENDSNTAWFRYLGYGSAIFRKFSYKGEAYSVRCIKN